MNSVRSWCIFWASAFAYLVAVLQRTSFGVAGVEATERFDASASAISMVAVVQVVVYAALQIPVGMLVDKIGAPILITAGALIMACGQLILSVADSVGLALVARILVGMGDAGIFVSVLRTLPGWFEGPILPQLSQWIGVIGQLGQLVSTFPFALLLHVQGWSWAFTAAAGMSLLAAIVVGFVVRTGTPALTTGQLRVVDPSERGFRASLQRPGTQLGFWAHGVAGMIPTVVGVMWGYPYLTAGLGYTAGTASAVFLLLVVGAVVSGPIVGILIAKYPARRSDLVLAISAATFAMWTVALLWQPAPPVWFVGALFFCIGMCSPASVVGLDVARSSNPHHAHGSAAGIANSGGFISGFLGMLLVGIVLDVVNDLRVSEGMASDLYSMDGFRLAFFATYVLGAIWAVGVLVTRRRARRRIFDEQGIQIAPLWVALFVARGRKRP